MMVGHVLDTQVVQVEVEAPQSVKAHIKVRVSGVRDATENNW